MRVAFDDGTLRYSCTVWRPSSTGAVPPPVSGPVSFAPPPPKHEPEPEAEPVQGQEEPQAPAAEPVLKPAGESVASEPESAPEPEPVSEEAAESGEEKKTAKRRFHPSRGMVITLIVIAVLIVILGGAGAALYFLQKSEKLPEAIRPVGEVVVSTVDGWFVNTTSEICFHEIRLRSLSSACTKSLTAVR